MKTCSKCAVPKTLNYFYRRRDSADGRMSECKKCKNARTAAWRESNQRRVQWVDRRRAIRNRASTRRYYQTARGKMRLAAAQRRYRRHKKLFETGA